MKPFTSIVISVFLILSVVIHRSHDIVHNYKHPIDIENTENKNVQNLGSFETSNEQESVVFDYIFFQNQNLSCTLIDYQKCYVIGKIHNSIWQPPKIS